LIDLAGTVARQQRELQGALGQVQAARAFAESASQVKSNFLRMMSHELKTPLTAMLLQLELLARDPELEHNERLRQGHARIWRGSRRLLHLIDTMLEWARVESGRTRLYPERFDLVAIVDDVVRELATQAQQKHLAVEVRVAGGLQREIVSDRRLLTLVLLNLLGRALQLTPAGTVELRVDQNGGLRRIAINDGSPHRPAPDALAFEPSQPALPPDAGAGLGMHVVRDIARALGAELSFEEKDAGHVVTLALPSLELGVSQQPAAASPGAN
jgi:signal transduction histidine kinase